MFSLLRRFFSGERASSLGTVGSDADPIRQLLFASQSLREQVSRLRTDGPQGAAQSIVTLMMALIRRSENKKAEVGEVGSDSGDAA
jgi:hypothetical protein